MATEAVGRLSAAKANQRLPGLPGLTFSNFGTSSPALSANGSLLVSATVAGGGVTTANDTACWYGPVGSQNLIAQESTTVLPGSGGAVLSSSFGSLAMGNSVRTNNAGQVLFLSNLTGGDVSGSTNNSGLFLGNAAGVTKIWRKGDPIPGTPALPATDGPFMTQDSFGLHLNSAGEIIHTGTLVAGTAGGVSTADDKVVYTNVGEPIRIVAREGYPVPNFTTEFMFKNASSFSPASLAINSSGKIVFSSTLADVPPNANVTTANDTAWMMDDHGTMSIVIREGDAIDGETFNFAQSSGGMFINNNDTIVIAGAVVGAGDTGRLWTGPVGGPYTKIVEQGATPIPGTTDVFLDFSAGNANIAVNNADQIVFTSNLTGAGVTPGVDDFGVFGWDPDIGLVTIARKGVTSIPEILDVSSFSLIGVIGFTGDTGSAILTDNGWLVMRFQDVKGFQAIVRTKPFEPSEDCPTDIASIAGVGISDGVVDVSDMLAVITNWGAGRQSRRHRRLVRSRPRRRGRCQRSPCSHHLMGRVPVDSFLFCWNSSRRRWSIDRRRLSICACRWPGPTGTAGAATRQAVDAVVAAIGLAFLLSPPAVPEVPNRSKHCPYGRKR